MPALPLYWYFPMSVNCDKTGLALEESGYPVERRQVDLTASEQLSPAYMAINPAGLVPCLQLPGGVTLADSGDILLHLAEHATERGSLLPADDLDRATALAWFGRGRALPIEQLTFAYKALPGGDEMIARRDAAIERHLADPATPEELRPHYRRRLAGCQGRKDAGHAGADSDDARRLSLTAEVRAVVGALEADLADGRPFLAGAAYSLADCMWTALLARLHMIDLDSWWADRPRVATYFARMKARPSYAAVGIVDAPLRSTPPPSDGP